MSDRWESRLEDAKDEEASSDEERPVEPPLPDDALSLWIGRLALVALLALVVAAVVVEFGRERVRWRAAGAYRTYLTAYERNESGRIDEARRKERIVRAVEELRRAVGPDPEARWRAVEASWLLEAGEISAARTLLDELVEENPDWVGARADRMTAAVTAGDAKQVVADCDWLGNAYADRLVAYVSDPVSGASMTILVPNLRAYMLALANEQLDVAEKEIDRAISATEMSLGDNDFGKASLLDTQAFVAYRKGDFERAAKLFDKAVELLDKPAPKEGEPTGDLQIVRIYRRIAAEEAKDGPPPDIARLEQSRYYYEQAQSLAVMFYHRALALEARGFAEEAAADRRVVEELGFEANDELF